jgi:preprotein translocase subunit SecD
MNRYPRWKYAIIALAILVSAIYAVPNLFGEVPAVQVSGARANVKVDAPLRTSLEEALKAANVAVLETDQDEHALRFRFNDTDTQLRARDVIQAKVPQGYVVALNLVPNSPHWLQALGAKPMYLGLDLRGGVHFLLQVNVEAARNKLVERYLADVRALLRDKKIYYSGLAREGEPHRRALPRDRAAAAALKAISEAQPDLALRERSGAEGVLEATVKPDVMKRDQEDAITRNIQTLRNRVNELGVAEPIVQQQGPDRIVVQLAACRIRRARRKSSAARRPSKCAWFPRSTPQGPGKEAFAQYKDQPAPFGTDKFPDLEFGVPVIVKKNVVITGERITNAQPGFDDRGGGPVVNVRLDSQGGRVMRQTTRENVKKRMAMLLVEKTGTVVGHLAHDPGGVRRELPHHRHRRHAGSEEPGAAAARRRARRARWRSSRSAPSGRAWAPRTSRRATTRCSAASSRSPSS